MSLSNILKLAGGALNAQTVRLNTIASNLANVETVAGSEEKAFRAKRPVFATVMDQVSNEIQKGYGVTVKTITESRRANQQIFDPDNPLANSEGYVFRSNVNPLEEMTDMLDAARSFETALTTASTARELMMRTIDMNTK
ncbi:MAG: flagellar basal body rod protein FlgC [Gammaproteobacteria bacterium]|nr:flagellar basal body rod protein FlgC [Gammaproteobacteria bacterium]MBM4229309.1 flagellar basal body rod protein FlgC [Gammaproteobacteria bacterium]